MVPGLPKRIALVLQTRTEENVEILSGIVSYERQHTAWDFFLDDESMSIVDPSWLFRRDWDGVICRHPPATLFDVCREQGVVGVDLNDSPEATPGFPKIRPDNLAVGNLSAEYFIKAGFRRFAFCGYSTEAWSRERRDGFLQSMEVFGFSCAVYESPYLNVLTPDWDRTEQKAIGDWLKAMDPPVALLACHDMRAIQVISAAHHQGLRVPEDLAVMGVNNEPVRANLSPPLSSVSLNAAEWGHQAARILHLLLDKQSAPAETFIDPAGVVVRRSTDTLAVDDEAIKTALRIIRDEATQGLRVEELAKRVHLSRSLLERRFRKFIRRSPQEEIRAVRIDSARQLLADTDLTLAEIADATGFQHSEYLSVMFKRLTGISPSDYRHRHRRH